MGELCRGIVEISFSSHSVDILKGCCCAACLGVSWGVLGWPQAAVQILAFRTWLQVTVAALISAQHRAGHSAGTALGRPKLFVCTLLSSQQVATPFCGCHLGLVYKHSMDGRSIIIHKTSPEHLPRSFASMLKPP